MGGANSSHNPIPCSTRNARAIPAVHRVTDLDLITDLLGALDECHGSAGSIAGRGGSGPALNVLESVSAQARTPRVFARRETTGHGTRAAPEPPRLRFGSAGG